MTPPECYRVLQPLGGDRHHDRGGLVVSFYELDHVDHGVAFASAESDRGKLWKELRVDRFPADTVERLRAVTPEQLKQRLGVLAQWQLENGRYVPAPHGENFAPNRGVRSKDGILQMGLTDSEIMRVYRQLTRFLSQVDRGRFTLVAGSGP